MKWKVRGGSGGGDGVSGLWEVRRGGSRGGEQVMEWKAMGGNV